MRDKHAIRVRRRLRADRRHKRNVAIRRLPLVIALLALALPAFAQEPAPAASPSPDPAPQASASPTPQATATPAPESWHINVNAGVGTLVTRDMSTEYFRARLTVAGPIAKNLRGFLRGDLDQTQDGGVLDSLASLAKLKDTFKSIEVGAGLRYYVAPELSFGAVAGVTYSVESEANKPLDSRLYTLLGVFCSNTRDSGYVIPVKGGVFTAIDVDIPLQKRAGDQLAYTIKVGALVRIKTIQ